MKKSLQRFMAWPQQIKSQATAQRTWTMVTLIHSQSWIGYESLHVPKTNQKVVYWVYHSAFGGYTKISKEFVLYCFHLKWNQFTIQTLLFIQNYAKYMEDSSCFPSSRLVMIMLIYWNIFSIHMKLEFENIFSGSTL